MGSAPRNVRQVGKTPWTASLQWDAPEVPEAGIHCYCVEVPRHFLRFTNDTEIMVEKLFPNRKFLVLIKSCSREDTNSCRSPAFFQVTTDSEFVDSLSCIMRPELPSICSSGLSKHPAPSTPGEIGGSITHRPSLSRFFLMIPDSNS